MQGARVPALIARLARAARRAPLVVGHRGASATHPENTLVAFRKALADGAQVMEFDVHATADGALVVIHDETLDRTTDAVHVLGRAGTRVCDVDLPTLAKLDAGTWKAARFRGARIPTLEKVLDALGARAVAMIEHKGGSAERYVEELTRAGLRDRVLLQSFDWDFVREVKELAPDIPLGALGEGALGPKLLRRAARTGARLVHWDVDTLTVEDVERAHALGLLVCVYTANSDAELCGAARLGIDAITTNVPRRLRRLQERGLALRAFVTRR